MSSKQKLSKDQQKLNDSAENSRFLLVVAVATIILMLIMYFAFS